MNTLLSIDPGLRGIGSALWRDGQLIAAAYVKSPAREGNGPRECAQAAFEVCAWIVKKIDTLYVTHLAMEFPTTYSGRAAPGKDTRDLFPLAAVDGAFAALFPNSVVTYYIPREWKGSISKPDTTKEPYAVEAMVRRRLSETELACIEWPTNVKLTYDVTDAVGVGLKALGRFERQRVYARE